MNLRRLIEVLTEACAKHGRDTLIERGFHNPHSYRGYYECLSFEPARVTLGEMLAAAESAVGQVYEGYKGGEYRMSGATDVYVAPYGMSGEDDALTEDGLRWRIEEGSPRASLSAALKAKEEAERLLKLERGESLSVKRQCATLRAHLIAAEKRERSLEQGEWAAVTEAASLRSQLAQAREALKHIECVAGEERPPRDLEESARDLGRILTAARAALSPPSSGSGVDSRACGPCLDGDHERCAGAHCLCPHARVAYMLGSSPGSGVEREECERCGLEVVGSHHCPDPTPQYLTPAPTDGGGKR